MVMVLNAQEIEKVIFLSVFRLSPDAKLIIQNIVARCPRSVRNSTIFDNSRIKALSGIRYQDWFLGGDFLGCQ